ncbi:MAG: hypothetical protein R3D61_10990 [Defluviimonas denitrificans]
MVAVIGGGVAGVELALAAAHRLGDGAKVTIGRGNGPACRAGQGRSERFLRIWSGRGSICWPGAARDGRGRNRRLPLTTGAMYLRALSFGGHAPAPWLEATGLALDAGFVAVTETLQSKPIRRSLPVATSPR